MVARIEDHSSASGFCRRLGEHGRRQGVERHHDVGSWREFDDPLTRRAVVLLEWTRISRARRVSGVDDDAALPVRHMLQHLWNTRPRYGYDDDLRSDGLL